MFMYNASEVYGRAPPEKHHNSQPNNLINNNINNNTNSSNNRNEHNVRYCSVDNAFNYYKSASAIAPSWNLNSPSRASNPSPSKNKEIVGRQIERASYSVPVLDPVKYSDAYANSYAPARKTAAAAAANNNSYIYQHRQKADYYNGPAQHKVRQYAQTNNAPATQELTKYPQLTIEKDQLKRQLRVRNKCEYLDEGSTYSHNRRSPALEQTWSSITPERQTTRFHSTDQHYEHYFSYFYNRGAEKLSKAPQSSSYKTQMSLFQETPIKRSSNNANNGRRGISNDNNNQNVEYDSYLLKENNAMPFGYNDSDWNDIPVNETNLEIINIKDVYDTKVINDDDDGDDNDDQFDPTIQTHRRYVQHGDTNNDLSKNGKSVVKINNNVSKKLRNATESPALPRMPLTPKRIRGGQAITTTTTTTTTAKKVLPTVHRVLLYNSQSPRLARKHQSTNMRNQAVKNPHPKGHSAGGVQLTKYILDEPDFKSNDFRDVDFDNDDDLDNISNFDESDTVSISSDTEDGYRAHAYKMTHSGDRLLSSPKDSTSLLLSQSSDEDLRNPESVLVPSLFPYVPPYLSFSSNTKKGPSVPPELHRVLKWRVTNIMPKVVRLILANSGMRMLKKTNDWMGVWGKHLKSPCFKTIRSYQKINHLPGSFRIGRKDSCWKNLQRQMKKHSNREFGFMPRTYVIPNDLCALRKRWPKYAQRNTKWIIKPPASARGAGIRVVNRWGQIPKRRPLIVQRYIERPLLINGSKFDLRLYVLVTSVNPLRVFMYHNGLARFASVKYSAKADTLNDRCMHLTNYSINKFSSNYSKNEDVNACHGHKWTIKSLWTYLANRGVRTDGLWEALRSLVLRTILAGENGINSMIRANVESKYSCFELFGFDVILDSDLVPWLLEVNISPSLHSELPLDAHVKAPLVQGVLNTALYNIPPKLSQEKQKELAAELSFPSGTQLCYDKRLYINYLSREEKVKHTNFTRKSMESREEYIDAILQKLTPDDVRCLIIAEDELARCAPLERIFPTDQTHKYLKYNDTPRYYNRLLDAWESRYANNRTEGIALLRDYCQSKFHLQVPAPPAKKSAHYSCTPYTKTKTKRLRLF
ncbi:tubulin polyglutamylase TTLL4 isoform X2 [Drosophila grimshawi]|uniref:tubulin polyglutamylase TTLL4 isoform X2 n=1 Tax=Drosophila grimshawi TaxID=7222 RepID=UPI000C86E7E2|nr:tubulin polyglutamylase TTLL4 isoform X2 [Drosophila grimshawi]